MDEELDKMLTQLRRRLRARAVRNGAHSRDGCRCGHRRREHVGTSGLGACMKLFCECGRFDHQHLRIVRS